MGVGGGAVNSQQKLKNAITVRHWNDGSADAHAHTCTNYDILSSFVVEKITK